MTEIQPMEVRLGGPIPDEIAAENLDSKCSGITQYPSRNICSRSAIAVSEVT